MNGLTSVLRTLSRDRLPQWNAFLPRASSRLTPGKEHPENSLRVVYFPSCISRTMGLARGSQQQESQNKKIDSLLRKAGYEVVYPAGIDSLCCGMAFASKGFTKQGDAKAEELIEVLSRASQEGRYPVLFDTSPCLYRVRETISGQTKLKLYEPVEFVLQFLVSRLVFKALPVTVAVHGTAAPRRWVWKISCARLRNYARRM